jgi:hypothetical protein
MGRIYLMILALLVSCSPVYAALNQPTKALQIPKALVVSVATIASGQTSSAAIPTSGLSLVGIQMPAAFTGTTVTFLGSLDGTTYQTLKSTTSGTSLSYTVAQGTYVAIDPVPFYGLPYIKIVSGSAEGAARTLAIALKGI